MFKHLKKIFSKKEYIPNAYNIIFQDEDGTVLYDTNWKFDYQSSHQETTRELVELTEVLYKHEDQITDLQEQLVKLDRESVTYGNALFDILNAVADSRTSFEAVAQAKVIAENALKACK